MPVTAMDEARHQPGSTLAWEESWTFDFATADASLGGWVAMTLRPNRPTARYEAFLCGPDRDLLAVLDDEVPAPPRDLEIRTEGLWATHICETPLDHWTIGLEAFALGVDDPAELYGRQLGERVPLGFDLEWEATPPGTTRSPGAATEPPTRGQPAPGQAAGGPADRGRLQSYEQPCRVSGEILVGSTAIDLDATGSRWHRWGTTRAFDERHTVLTGRLEDGTTIVATVGGARGGGSGHDETWAAWTGRAGVENGIEDRVQAGSADDIGSGTVTAWTESFDGNGFPVASRLTITGHDGTTRRPREIGVDPVAVAPCERSDIEGRVVRTPRALCRLVTDDGVSGVGWAEWSQPVVPPDGR